MTEETDALSQDGEDFYAFLNIPKNATSEEITNAYRHLSRLYHPDKHTDPERKKEAEVLFSKTKKAYESLRDPHLRAIYDSLGIAGLETQGWEIVQRTKAPHEIREEYERLAREREEHRLQQRTNPKSTVNMNINATELFASYDHDSPYLDLRDVIGLPHIEISGMTLSQGIEAPLTTNDTAILNGNLTTQNGTGSGGVSCCLRRVTSAKGWGEMEVGAGNGLNISVKGFRNLQRGLFGNASLISHFTPQGVAMGTVVTLANQLDKHTMGYLTWKAGLQSGMNTMIIRDTQTSHVIASLHFGIPHTYCGLSYTHKLQDRDLKLQVSGKAGTFGAILEYGAKKKVSEHSFLSASVSVGVPTGVQLKIKLLRASQTYSTSILLCEDILPAPIIYGTVVPLVTYLALNRLIIVPYIKRQKVDELKKQKEANKARLSQKRQEALSAVQLMKETVRRIVETEEAKKGLVIIQALYGSLVSPESPPTQGDSLQMGESNPSSDVIDVTIPLQCLVKDSKLILQESSKSQLPGFYDPCPGESKLLRVQYLFHAVNHLAITKDNEALRIPKQSHRTEA